MPLDIMTTRQFKSISSSGALSIRAFHTNVAALDRRLTAYHAIPKDQIERRIRALSDLMHACESYSRTKRNDNPRLSDAQTRKVSAADLLHEQAEAKREYLAKVLGIERNLSRRYGGTRETMKNVPPEERFRELATTLSGFLKYLGKPSEGRMLHESYWHEAIDPLHRNWGNPAFSPIHQRWVTLRFEEGTTQLSFYRWFETLTDADVERIVPGGITGTAYQSAAGREELRVLVSPPDLPHMLARLDAREEAVPFSTEEYKTNFAGPGWGIFVISPEGRLYSNSHDQVRGWFHSAFLGGQPVKAAGEIYARDGVLYAMTPKSGHYKPRPEEIVAGLRSLDDQGLDLTATQVMQFLFNPVTGRGFAGPAGGMMVEWYDAYEYIRSDGAAGFLRQENVSGQYRYVWDDQKAARNDKLRPVQGDEWLSKDFMRGSRFPADTMR